MTTTATRLVHPTARPLRVQVVDDNDDCADSMKMLLVASGCDVAVCYSGTQAVTLAEKFRPDVCLLDIRMPRMNGLDVAQALRKWARGRLLLLIAITGMGGLKAEEDSLYAGFDHHLVKPSDTEELLRDFPKFIVKMEATVRELV